MLNTVLWFLILVLNAANLGVMIYRDCKEENKDKKENGDER